ncbi:hypothetical protein PR048_031852 [Dryococelus australis]|uniref:Uncharacterized protein n=1 Tax=Dryococelus australis TaxID=614101 RepID=A0ABQ9G6F7_9NEOP|nr:hypothetical protein PR048_031852 [Dryococelus australis]
MVVPIHKQGEDREACSYRPVSLLVVPIHKQGEDRGGLQLQTGEFHWWYLYTSRERIGEAWQLQTEAWQLQTGEFHWWYLYTSRERIGGGLQLQTGEFHWWYLYTSRRDRERPGSYRPGEAWQLQTSEFHWWYLYTSRERIGRGLAATTSEFHWCTYTQAGEDRGGLAATDRIGEAWQLQTGVSLVYLYTSRERIGKAWQLQTGEDRESLAATDREFHWWYLYTSRERIGDTGSYRPVSFTGGTYTQAGEDRGRPGSYRPVSFTGVPIHKQERIGGGLAATDRERPGSYRPVSFTGGTYTQAGRGYGEAWQLQTGDGFTGGTYTTSRERIRRGLAATDR